MELADWWEWCNHNNTKNYGRTLHGMLAIGLNLISCQDELTATGWKTAANHCWLKGCQCQIGENNDSTDWRGQTAKRTTSRSKIATLTNPKTVCTTPTSQPKVSTLQARWGLWREKQSHWWSMVYISCGFCPGSSWWINYSKAQKVRKRRSVWHSSTSAIKDRRQPNNKVTQSTHKEHDFKKDISSVQMQTIYKIMT